MKAFLSVAIHNECTALINIINAGPKPDATSFTAAGSTLAIQVCMDNNGFAAALSGFVGSAAQLASNVVAVTAAVLGLEKLLANGIDCDMVAQQGIAALYLQVDTIVPGATEAHSTIQYFNNFASLPNPNSNSVSDSFTSSKFMDNR